MALAKARKELKKLFPKKERRHALKAEIHQTPAVSSLLTGVDGLSDREEAQTAATFQLRMQRGTGDRHGLADRNSHNLQEAKRDFVSTTMKVLRQYKKLVNELTILAHAHQSNAHKPKAVVIHLERLKYLRAYKYLLRDINLLLQHEHILIFPPYTAAEFNAIKTHCLQISQNLIDRSERPPVHERASFFSRLSLTKRTHHIDMIAPGVEIVPELPAPVPAYQAQHQTVVQGQYPQHVLDYIQQEVAPPYSPPVGNLQVHEQSPQQDEDAPPPYSPA
jgi:hypothetical protein